MNNSEMTNDEIYIELSKIYSDKEIAESFIFSGKINDEETSAITEYIKKQKEYNGRS